MNISLPLISHRLAIIRLARVYLKILNCFVVGKLRKSLRIRPFFPEIEQTFQVQAALVDFDTSSRLWWTPAGKGKNKRADEKKEHQS